MQLVLQQADQKSWFNRVNGLGKILAGFVFCIVVLASATQTLGQLSWLALWTIGLMILALRLNARLKIYFLRSALMFFLLTLPLPFKSFTPHDVTLIRFAGLSVFLSGVWHFFSVFLKAMVILTTSLIIVGSTPYPQLLQAFQKLRMPGWILAILMYMFRLIFLMEEESLRLKRAIRARSGKLSLNRKFKILSDFSVIYLARLMERSERNYQAMISRGFSGKVRLIAEQPLHKKDLLPLLAPLIFLSGMFL